MVASSTSDTSTLTVASNSVISPVSEATEAPATTATGYDVVIITQTTTVDPVVTVFASPSTQSPTPQPTISLSLNITLPSTTPTPSSSSEDDDTVTVTQTITSTLTPAAAATSVPTTLSILDLFPNCANLTSSIPALANLTIPNVVLPSNLTLAQVLGVSGQNNIDCATLLELLGVNNGTANGTAPVRRRGVQNFRRTFRYRMD